MKNYICLFILNTFFFFSNITGAQKSDSHIPKDYTYQIVKCTHEINKCFLNIHNCIETHPLIADDYIKNCRIYLARLEDEIKNFKTFQNQTLTNIFNQIKKCSSKTEMSFIEDEIIPNLASINKTENLGYSIVSPLSQIRSELEILAAIAHNPQSTPEQRYEKLNSIQEKYNIIFENQKIQNICKKKYSLKKDILIEPLRKKDKIAKIMRILNVVLWIGKIIEWMPFRDTIRKWLLSEDNLLVKTLIIWLEGKKNYEKIKVYFPQIKRFDNKIIRTDALCRYIHTTLQMNPCQIFLTFMKNKNNAEPYLKYAEKIQEYLFIEFLECLQKSHYGSIKMIARKNNKFSFNYDEKRPIQASSEKNNIIREDIDLHKYAIDTIYGVKEYIKSSSFDTICRDAQNTLHSCATFGKLFFTTLLPSNDPTIQGNIIQKAPKKIQKPIITLTKPNNTITDFLQLHTLLKTHFDEKEDLSKKFPQKFIQHNNLLENMLEQHRTLNKKLKKHYQKHKDQIAAQGNNEHTFLPKKWNDLLLETNKLYGQLEEENKKEKKDKKTIKEIKSKLDQHIEAYNLMKIDLYTADDLNYSKTRNAFSKIFTLSKKDIHDVKDLIKQKPLLDEYRYMFNPLERAELGF